MSEPQEELEDLFEKTEDLFRVSFPFCVDCQFIGTVPSGDWERYRCFAPQNILEHTRNPVSGMQVTVCLHDTCALARKEALSKTPCCGKAGRWFRQKEPKPAAPTAETLDIDDIVGDIDL